MRVLTRSAVAPLVILFQRDKKGPPILICRGPTRLTYAWEVEIVGNSRIVSASRKPYDRRARVWIEATQVIVRK